MLSLPERLRYSAKDFATGIRRYQRRRQVAFRFRMCRPPDFLVPIWPSLPKLYPDGERHGPRMPTASQHLSEGKIDASSPGQRMLPVLERRDAVIDEACGTAPHRDVTAFEVQAAHRIGAAFDAPQEYGGQAER